MAEEIELGIVSVPGHPVMRVFGPEGHATAFRNWLAETAQRIESGEPVSVLAISHPWRAKVILPTFAYESTYLDLRIRFEAPTAEALQELMVKNEAPADW